MAHYRDYSQEQARLLPISLQQQIQPGTIEHTISYLVDHEVDLRVFESHYHNDATGAPAIHPRNLVEGNPVGLLARHHQQPSYISLLRGERAVHGARCRHTTPLHHYR